MDSSQVELYSHCNTLAQLHVLTPSPFFSCAVPQVCPCYLHPLGNGQIFFLILGFDCSAAMRGTGAKRSE